MDQSHYAENLKNIFKKKVTGVKNAQYQFQAWEMSVKLQISAAVKLIFQGDGEVCPSVGKKFGDTKKKRSTSFSSARITHAHSDRVHVWFLLILQPRYTTWDIPSI